MTRLADHLLTLGIEPAEPGEFSRRAFLSGRIDLIEAEGIADLVAAETEEQRRQALDQVEGGLSATLTAWRESVRVLLARCEARIDFPDDLAGDQDDHVSADEDIGALVSALSDHVARGTEDLQVGAMR